MVYNDKEIESVRDIYNWKGKLHAFELWCEEKRYVKPFDIECWLSNILNSRNHTFLISEYLDTIEEDTRSPHLLELIEEYRKTRTVNETPHSDLPSPYNR
jgi:hypothetical protein